MELLYIAAPYRAKTIIKLQHNIHEASKMAQYYWHQGFAVICPHLNTANFDGLLPDEIFLQGTKLMLAHCTHIALHPKWTVSTGCIDEYKQAERAKLNIHFTNMHKVNGFINSLK